MQIAQENADAFDLTWPLLNSMYLEFKELSKKKPDAGVSKGKIKIVNRLLEKIRGVLAEEEALEFLDLLDEVEVPQVSDVTLILSQYVAAMREYKTNHQTERNYKKVWDIA